MDGLLKGTEAPDDCQDSQDAKFQNIPHTDATSLPPPAAASAREPTEPLAAQVPLGTPPPAHAAELPPPLPLPVSSGRVAELKRRMSRSASPPNTAAAAARRPPPPSAIGRAAAGAGE